MSKKNYKDALECLECAVRSIQEHAADMGYTLISLDRLSRALAVIQAAVHKLEQMEGTMNEVFLPAGDKPRIFFDMDGTLSEWEDNPIEEVAKPGYFYSRKPVHNMIEAMRVLAKMPDYEVYILSSVFMDEHSVSEKIAWNALYTALPRAKQIYVPYGQDKNAFLEECGGICPEDVLVDDFSYNLHKWKGIGIKVFNGVNGTKGTWQGPAVKNTDSCSSIVETILDIMNERR